MANNTTEELYNTLQAQLAGSTGAERIAWAKDIVANDCLKQLLPLLMGDKQTAYRFSWLLSDVGMADPEVLFRELPYMFSIRQQVTAPKFGGQFVKYWRMAGIPEEHEGEAIDIMFQYVMDPKADTHIKTVSLTVLHGLAKKYPELNNEIKLCIEEQINTADVSFQKTAKKILAEL